MAAPAPRVGASPPASPHRCHSWRRSPPGCSCHWLPRPPHARCRSSCRCGWAGPARTQQSAGGGTNGTARLALGGGGVGVHQGRPRGRGASALARPRSGAGSRAGGGKSSRQTAGGPWRPRNSASARQGAHRGGHVVAADATRLPRVGRQAHIQQLRGDVVRLLAPGQPLSHKVNHLLAAGGTGVGVGGGEVRGGGQRQGRRRLPGTRPTRRWRAAACLPPGWRACKPHLPPQKGREGEGPQPCPWTLNVVNRLIKKS